jgi:hypothetical protein
MSAIPAANLHFSPQNRAGSNVERPKTSRRVANPTIEDFTSYVIPSPSPVGVDEQSNNDKGVAFVNFDNIRKNMNAESINFDDSNVDDLLRAAAKGSKEEYNIGVPVRVPTLDNPDERKKMLMSLGCWLFGASMST